MDQTQQAVKKRPAHEVLLDAVDRLVESVWDPGSMDSRAANKRALTIVCVALAEMYVPPRHIPEVISKLEEIRKKDVTQTGLVWAALTDLIDTLRSDEESAHEAGPPGPPEGTKGVAG